MSLDILAEVVRLRTYAAKLPDGTKETHTQTVDRCKNMHIKKFPKLESEINDAFKFVHEKKVVPSMRSLQFSGGAIERVNEKLYNCTALAITEFRDFADALYLLSCGCGVGYSVQHRHVSQLPKIERGTHVLHEIDDTKEAWADSILALMKNPETEFNYDAIRPHGAPLSSGGTASGKECLQECHAQVYKILAKAVGRQLLPYEVSDIICHIANCIVSGGVRRSALICLFDADNVDMLEYKSGKWWESNPQRGKANVSAVLHRKDLEFNTKFNRIMDNCFASNSGEPGVFLTNDFDMLTNPCVEIALRDKQMCNLTEVNVALLKTPKELFQAVIAATVIGTIQASYTNFTYINPKFKENCEAEALLGVSFTGQAENWKLLSEDNLKDCAHLAKSANEIIAKMIGINPAARIGCTKPSGSTSAVLSTTSGIHAAFAPYYLRRVRILKADPIARFLAKKVPELIEEDLFDNYSTIFTVPVNKSGAIQRGTETAIEILERMKHINKNWIHTSHRSGDNRHNVSLTVNYHPHEIVDVKAWMLENSDIYSGISLLPFDGGSYKQLPFEAITEEEYIKWCEKLPADLDLSAINYGEQIDERQGEIACGGGSCEIR